MTKKLIKIRFINNLNLIFFFNVKKERWLLKKWIYFYNHELYFSQKNRSEIINILYNIKE